MFRFQRSDKENNFDLIKSTVILFNICHETSMKILSMTTDGMSEWKQNEDEQMYRCMKQKSSLNGG